jgi:hypothetical protein
MYADSMFPPKKRSTTYTLFNSAVILSRKILILSIAKELMIDRLSAVSSAFIF